MAAEFTVGGHTYLCGSMPTLEQNRVARKFASVLIIVGGMQQANPKVAISDKDCARAILSAAARIPDEDFDYVIGSCLAIVQRKQRDGFSPVRSPGGELMFSDIEIIDLNIIVYKVLKTIGLIDFFYAGPPSGGATGTPAAQQ